MYTSIAAIALLITIAAALAVGVLLGYAAVTAVLHAMHRPQREAERALAASEASGGD